MDNPENREVVVPNPDDMKVTQTFHLCEFLSC